MEQRKIVGEFGEKTAVEYLKQKGYRHLASNYSTRFGEIDLIMEDGQVVVFVEVKARRNDHYGAGYEAVGYWKQKKLARTAITFLLDQRLENRPCRFDVVSLSIDGIHHFENAFMMPDNFYL